MLACSKPSSSIRHNGLGGVSGDVDYESQARRRYSYISSEWRRAVEMEANNERTTGVSDSASRGWAVTAVITRRDEFKSMQRPAPVTGSSDQVPVVRVIGLQKQFRRSDRSLVTVVSDMSFDLPPGECLVLLGPSGCGKTTLLRCIAGLESPDGGRIEVRGRTVYSAADRVDVPTRLRNTSMVFQSYALWPHMTVADNVAYPLKSRPRRQRPPKPELRQRVQSMLARVGIDAVGSQHPSQISGGQQQRAALCRALIAASDLVLFDEPLSNVDAQVREILREDLRQMQRDLGFASIFVTHDRDEAMALADKIAVLDAGRLVQLGTPQEIYQSPSDRYVARFVGHVNEWPTARVQFSADGTFTGETAQGRVRGQSRLAATPGGAYVAFCRPENCSLSKEKPRSGNAWIGTVESAVYYGAATHYQIRAGSQSTRASVVGPSRHDIGSQIWVSVECDDLWLLPVGADGRLPETRPPQNTPAAGLTGPTP